MKPDQPKPRKQDAATPMTRFCGCDNPPHLHATEEHQPSPTTGEWTEPVLEDGVCRVYCGKEIMFTVGEQYRSTADAIRKKVNAALAADRKLAHQAEQAATDNADWFDQLCIDLRKLMGMPEDKRPFSVQPILDEVTKRYASVASLANHP